MAKLTEERREALYTQAFQLLHRANEMLDELFEKHKKEERRKKKEERRKK